LRGLLRTSAPLRFLRPQLVLHSFPLPAIPKPQFDILDGVRGSLSAIVRLLLILGGISVLPIHPFATLSAPIKHSLAARNFRLPATSLSGEVQSPPPSSPASPVSAGQLPGSSSVQSPSVPQQNVSTVVHETLPTIVIDPAHGGADAGARGTSGLLEKDLTLMLADALRTECEREGFRVLLTREGDQDPSFDERAGIANAHHGAIFISLHVSSTGSPGTVRTYVYPAVTAEQAAAANTEDNSSASGGNYRQSGSPGQGLPEWDRAQQAFVADSRKLGDLIQVELSQKFSQSPELSTAVRVRDLRSVTVPAVAVEISSVEVADVQSVRKMIPVVAASIARGISGFGRSSVGVGR